MCGSRIYRAVAGNRRDWRPCELDGWGFIIRRIDLDAALEVGAVFDADSSAENIANNGAVFCDFDASPRIDVADSFAVDNHFAGVNFRIELRRGTDGERMAIKENRAIHNDVDLK